MRRRRRRRRCFLIGLKMTDGLRSALLTGLQNAGGEKTEVERIFWIHFSGFLSVVTVVMLSSSVFVAAIVRVPEFVYFPYP